MDQGGDT